MSAIKVTPQGTIYAYILRTAQGAPDVVTYGPDEGQRGKLGGGFVGNALGVYGIDGLGGKRAFLLPSRELVLETAVTATKNERDVAPDTTTDPSPAHVVTLTVDGQTKYSETLP